MIKFEASVKKKDNTVMNCYTTSMDGLMNFLGEYKKEPQWVIDHKTGELLFRANHPTEEDYVDEHFELMCLGWMIVEPEPTPDPHERLMNDILKVSQEFGINLRIPN